MPAEVTRNLGSLVLGLPGNHIFDTVFGRDGLNEKEKPNSKGTPALSKGFCRGFFQ